HPGLPAVETRVLRRVTVHGHDLPPPAADDECVAIEDPVKLRRHRRHELRIGIHPPAERRERFLPAPVATVVCEPPLDARRVAGEPRPLRVEPLGLRAPEPSAPALGEPPRVAHVVGMEVGDDDARERPAAECSGEAALPQGARALGAVVAVPAVHAQIAVSANDNKVVLVNGVVKVVPNPPPDTVTIIDLKAWPPKVLGEVEAPGSVVGPPLSVAITPDESLALVTAA